MFEFSELSISTAVIFFLLATTAIAVFGSMMTKLADELADITGLGEALIGAVLLGGSTSLPGITTSVTAAFEGHAELAFSNAIGGIAVQTAFLAIADVSYRKANLEHAAASIANLMQGALLVSLLSIVIITISAPQFTIYHIHPASFLLIAAYIFGIKLVSKAQTEPMWQPRFTLETKLDKIEKIKITSAKLSFIWIKFILLASIVCGAGYIVAECGVVLSSKSGLSQTFIGGLFTAFSTSLPELVTSIAAVRQGALTLAVAGIIGGNCFDVLFVAFSDFAFREGSIYGSVNSNQLFIIALTILMTGILILGLLRREKYGIGNIGFESFLILVLYFSAFIFLLIGN